jgi:hypothetical protein
VSLVPVTISSGHRTSTTTPRLPLVTGEARFGPERVERDDPLAAIEIRHRRLMVGIAIDDAVFFGPEDAGA